MRRVLMKGLRRCSMTDRLIIDRITPDDKEDYFNSISHDKKVLETFVLE